MFPSMRWTTLTLLLFGCAAQPAPDRRPTEPVLEVVWESPDLQLTGVAVSAAGRVFVNFPRWGGPHDLAVAEITPEGLMPYPDSGWNSWTEERPERAAESFVCVQSVVVDADDTLWILDPASVGGAGIVEGGAKLVAVDLRTNAVRRVIRFSGQAAPLLSYLNDLRVDTRTGTAYITDSGLGAVLVVDLASGTTRRVLDGHPALRADPELVPLIGGREWRLPDGQVPQIHVDGIALHLDAGRLYLHARSPAGGCGRWQPISSATRLPMTRSLPRTSKTTARLLSPTE